MLRINEADKAHKYYKRGGVIKGGWKDKKGSSKTIYLSICIQKYNHEVKKGRRERITQGGGGWGGRGIFYSLPTQDTKYMYVYHIISVCVCVCVCTAAMDKVSNYKPAIL